jgi:hypothetical protein
VLRPPNAPRSRVSGTAQSSQVYVWRQADSQNSHWRFPRGVVSCMAAPASHPAAFTTRAFHEGARAGAAAWPAESPVPPHACFSVSPAGMMSHPEVA